jgi:Zn-dependent protease
MRSNIKIAKVKGIDIGLHYSWFIIAALIAFSLAKQFHHANPDWSTHKIWATAVLTAALFFISLLVHELAHSLVAQSHGMRVREITLFALGGVSQIEDEANDAKTEFWMAIAGPIASLIIGFGCLGIASHFGWHYSTTVHTVTAEILGWLGVINVSLALFNLIPGFPLDGGRVLRAILWAITKNADRATRIAARLGKVVALAFIVYGIWEFFSGGGFNGLWVVFIGWFLMDAAKASYAEVEITSALRDVRVEQVMSRDCAIVNREMSLQDFVDAHLLMSGDRCFAVEDHASMVGIITPRDVAQIPRERWGSTTVDQAMRPLQQLHIIAPNTPVVDALKLMARNDVNQLPVVSNGTLEGIISRSQLLQLLTTRSELRIPMAYQAKSRRQSAA